MTIGDARLENRAEEFRIGRVVSRTFAVLFAHPVTFLALSALLSIPSVLLGYCLVEVRAAGNTLSGLGRVLVMGLLETILLMILGCLTQAVLTKAALSSLNDERPDIGQSLSIAINSFLPFAAIGILMALGFVLGLALLVVPCIILMIMWAVVVPVKVARGYWCGRNFSRSQALTTRISLAHLSSASGFYSDIHWRKRPCAQSRRHRLYDQDSRTSRLSYVVVDWIERTIVTLVNVVITASIYYELRLVKEGLGDHQMAAAFD